MPSKFASTQQQVTNGISMARLGSVLWPVADRWMSVHCQIGLVTKIWDYGLMSYCFVNSMEGMWIITILDSMVSQTASEE